MPAYEILVNGNPQKIELTKTGRNSFTAKIDEKTFNIRLPAAEFDPERKFDIEIDDKTYKIELPRISRKKPFSIKIEEATFTAEVKTSKRKISLASFEPTRAMPMQKTTATKHVAEGAVTAPMTGKILSMMVKDGDQVKAGQVLCILEAMKMENEISAPKAGTIREVHVSEGASVNEGEILLLID